MRRSLWLAPVLALFCAMAQDDALVVKSRAARQALVAGHYQQAVSLYRELVSALPDNPGLRLNLGLALEKAGQPSAAIPELERVSREQPESAPAWFLLGLAYQQLKQPRKAIAPLRQAVRLDKTNAQALLELGDAELAAGDLENAAGDFQTLTASHPEMAKAWQGLGLSYVTLGERFFAQLDQASVRSPYWYALMARARASEGRYGEALRLYEAAIRQKPSIPGLHAARAEIYRETKHPDWAAVEDERESRAPKSESANEWAKSLADARQSATPQNLYGAALACGKLAERSFARLAELPPSPEIHEILAESYQRSGRRLEAVEEWRSALAMAPNDRRVQGRLAKSLIRAREYEQAERLLEPLVAAEPENGEWQYLLGDALFELRRADTALPHLLASVRLLPDYLAAREVLGRTYLALGQPEKAVQHLERSQPLDDGAISFALSTAYRRLGQDEKAREALARYQQFTKRTSGPGSISDSDAIPPP